MPVPIILPKTQARSMADTNLLNTRNRPRKFGYAVYYDNIESRGYKQGSKLATMNQHMQDYANRYSDAVRSGELIDPSPIIDSNQTPGIVVVNGNEYPIVTEQFGGINTGSSIWTYVLLVIVGMVLYNLSQ